MKKIAGAVVLMACAFHPDSWARGGQVDSTFGTNGVATFPTRGDNYYRYAMTSLADGRLIVAHTVSTSVDLFMYRADGTLDTSSGQSGVVNISGVSVDAIGTYPDGRMLLAGSDMDTKKLLLTRLLPNGAADVSFGPNGRMTYPVGDLYGVRVRSIRILPGGSIMVTAIPLTWPGPPTASGYLSIAKITPAGVLDAAYGRGGVVDHAFGYVWGGATASDVRVFDDGSVEFVQSALPKAIRKSRLRADGSLDTAMSASGVLSQDTILPANSYNLPPGVVFLEDGSLLALALADSAGNRLAVSRYGADFALDRSFGSDGIAIVDSGGFAGRVADGGYLFVGAGPTDLVIRKTTAKGAPDPAFGTNGVARVPLPVPDPSGFIVPQTQAITADGYVAILAGVLQVNTGASRYYVAKAQAVGDIVEFRNATLDHYFVTYDGDEARGIDAGAAGPGWSRTGASFRPGGSTPVCRFYGTPGIGPTRISSPRRRTSASR